MFLNPATDNVLIEFSPSFFETPFIEKYNDFLFHMNGPIKDMQTFIMESIQEIEIPGTSLNVLEIQSIPNIKSSGKQYGINFPETSINVQYPGTSNKNDIIESKSLSLTLRNTILNWSYFYESLDGYFRRTRIIKEFDIVITLLDSAWIPMLSFVFHNCFVSLLPSLTFGFNSQIREIKTFNAGITFNSMDINVQIPDFKMSKYNLNSN